MSTTAAASTAAGQNATKSNTLDFSTVGWELTYWLSHIGQSYSAHSGPQGQPEGERGYDFTLPYHTPVYAVSSGPVLGTGYYAGGGVVSVKMNDTQSIYYQHLSDIAVNPGDPVSAGQLVGWSGGQNGYGDHPASPDYSSWPHIEVGINGPWGGFWKPLGANIDPLPMFQAMVKDTALFATPTSQTNGGGGGGNGGGGGTTPYGYTTTPAKCTPPTGGDFVNGAAWARYWACLAANGGGSIGQQISAGIGSAFGNFFSGFSLSRVLKFAAGALMIVSAVIILILPDAADVALSAAGAPQLGEAVRQGLSHPLKSGTPGAVAGTVRRTVNQRAQEKAQATRAYANYQSAARQYQEKRQADVIKEFQKRQAAPTRPLRGKLGATRNPMTNEEIRQAQAKPAKATPQAAPVLPTPPKPQRGPKTGLRENLFTRGARRVFSRKPIPDAEVLRTEDLIHRREAKYQQPASNAPSIDDIMKDLRKPKK